LLLTGEDIIISLVITLHY